MKESLIDAIKEGLRVVVLSVIPVAIVGLQDGNLDLRYIYVTGAVALLRFLDKLLHEEAKDNPLKTRNTGMLGERGITGF
ncbi:MAG: hypothetical protein NUV44_10845 [Candidatus Scalindua sp.]|nr:hypothetical protein [Candidatus Scalindua sp.]